jgi:histidinol-phosphate aminotransferase
MARLPEHPNLAVMRTVSKLGLRRHAPRLPGRPPRLAVELEKVRPPYNVSVLTEAAALYALEHADALDAQADRIRAARRGLSTRWPRCPGVTPFPTRANFVLSRVADPAGVMAALRGRGAGQGRLARPPLLPTACA